MATVAHAPVRPPALLLRYWPQILGLAVVLVPTLLRLGEENWTTEAGVQGPIILATGIWLFFARRDVLEREAGRGDSRLFWPLFLLTGFAYIVGRAFGLLVVEVAAAVALCELLFYLHFGGRVTRRLWFALLYLYFIVPLPGWFQDNLTGALKEWVSASVTAILSGFGVPVFRQGVVLYVAQYQLLVEDACSGLNSLTSLLAIGLFYIYVLHQASIRYAAFLTLTILPVAIFANMVRVMILVLLTYLVSDSAAQGFLHKTAGMVTFITALLTIMAIDALAQRLLGDRAKGRMHAV